MRALCGGILAACLMAVPAAAQDTGGGEDELRAALVGEWSLSEDACGSWRVVFTHTGTTETRSIAEDGWMSEGVGTFAIDGSSVTILRASNSQVFAVKDVQSDRLVVSEASGPDTDLVRCSWAGHDTSGLLPRPGSYGF